MEDFQTEKARLKRAIEARIQLEKDDLEKFVAIDKEVIICICHAPCKAFVESYTHLYSLRWQHRSFNSEISRTN